MFGRSGVEAAVAEIELTANPNVAKATSNKEGEEVMSESEETNVVVQEKRCDNGPSS